MTPIILSPVPRCPSKEIAKGTVEKTGYVAWAKEVAETEKADFIDLNRLVLGKYVGLSPADIKAKYFTPADGTHTSKDGALLNAECVAEGVKGMQASELRACLAR